MTHEAAPQTPAQPTGGHEGDDLFDDADLGMHTDQGNDRLRTVCAATARVLDAGLGRDVALMTLHGGLAALERDGLAEWSDTVVRETLAAALEPDCVAAGVAPFTDDDINDVALTVAKRSLDSYLTGWLKGHTEAQAT